MLVNARLAVIGRLPPMHPPEAVAGGIPAAAFATRRAQIEGVEQELPVFEFAALAAGQEIAGPAIVESDTTTVLLLAGDTARMDGHGWLAMVLPGD